jgi:arylsulfatase A-like enzyme
MAWRSLKPNARRTILLMMPSFRSPFTQPRLVALTAAGLLFLVAADHFGLFAWLFTRVVDERVIQLLTLPPDKMELRSPLWDYQASLSPPWKTSVNTPGWTEYSWEGDLDADPELPGLEVFSGDERIPAASPGTAPTTSGTGFSFTLGQEMFRVATLSLPAHRTDLVSFEVCITHPSPTLVFQARRDGSRLPFVLFALGKAWSTTLRIDSDEWSSHRLSLGRIDPGTYTLRIDGTRSQVPSFFLKDLRLLQPARVAVRLPPGQPAPRIEYHPADPEAHLLAGGTPAALPAPVRSPWAVYDEDSRWVRTVEIGELVRTGICLPAPSAWSVEVETSRPMNLRFYPALHSSSSAARNPAQALLRVSAESGGRVFPLWDQWVRSGGLDAESQWEHGVTVPLPDTGSQPLRIQFETRPLNTGRTPQIFVAEPQLFPQEESGGDSLFPNRLERPNIVLISIDTLRADAVSCLGYERKTTPWMEEYFGNNGVRFTRAQAPCTWTLPSHAGLFLSQFVSRHGVGSEDVRIPSSVTMLAEAFAEQGYETAAFVDKGFMDANYGFSQGFARYDQRAGHFASSLPRCLDFLAHRDRRVPLFLFLHTYDVHAPYAAPEPYRSAFLTPDLVPPHDLRLVTPSPSVLQAANRESDNGAVMLDPKFAPYWRALYDGGVLFVDHQLRGFFDTVQDNGFLDTPLTILFSDHGESFFEHGSWGHGWNVYEELAHVPILVRFPGGDHAGRVCEERVSLLDVAPTLFEILGWPPRDGWQGRSLMPLIEGKPSAEPRRIFSELQRDLFRFSAVYLQNKKFIETRHKRERTEPPSPSSREIYDLASDPREKNSLSEVSIAGASEEFKRASSALALMENQRSGEGGGEQVDLSAEDVRELQAQGYMH